MVLWFDVRVAHCDGHAGMPERLADVGQIRTSHAHPCGAGVPQIMEAEILQPGVVDSLLKQLAEITRVEDLAFPLAGDAGQC